jgi:hypothetical protein
MTSAEQESSPQLEQHVEDLHALQPERLVDYRSYIRRSKKILKGPHRHGQPREKEERRIAVREGSRFIHIKQICYINKNVSE